MGGRGRTDLTSFRPQLSSSPARADLHKFAAVTLGLPRSPCWITNEALATEQWRYNHTPDYETSRKRLQQPWGLYDLKKVWCKRQGETTANTFPKK